MSDTENPYRSPETTATAAPGTGGQLTDTMIRYLRGASPWVRFIGVLFYVGVVLVALLARFAHK